MHCCRLSKDNRQCYRPIYEKNYCYFHYTVSIKKKSVSFDKNLEKVKEYYLSIEECYDKYRCYQEIKIRIMLGVCLWSGS